MPVDLNQLQNKFDFASEPTPYDLVQAEYQLQDETDEFAMYRAVIGDAKANDNYIYLSEKTLQNMAEAAGPDIPVLRHHDMRDFPIGGLVSGTYQSSRKRTVADFRITKDNETDVIRRRLDNGTIRSVSPKIFGKVTCNVCSERMYRWGGDKNDHYLGETIVVNGKEILVEGTFEDGQMKELSLVTFGAMKNAKTFSENEDLLIQAYNDKLISEKALDKINQDYSLDITPKERRSTSLPPRRSTPMATPTEADVQVLQDRVTDLEASNTEKDNEIATMKTDFEAKEQEHAEALSAKDDKIAELNGKLIEKDGEIGQAEALKADFDGSIAYVREQAISFYAKVRNTDKDNSTDALFLSRKEALEKSTSLSYLLGALQQYQEDYYARFTQFGGNTIKDGEVQTQASDLVAIAGGFNI